MSGRCRSCNVILSEEEMVHKWPGTPEYSDMCFTCINLSDDDADTELFNIDNAIIDTLPENLE